MSAALLVKLFAAPLLIGLASLAGKRWGPSIAGLLGGLPLVGGPVVVALWLTSGPQYAHEVALAAPAGVWANIAYFLILGRVSANWRWYTAIPFAWACYLLAGIAISAAGLAHSLVLGLAIIPAGWLAATRWLSKPQSVPGPVHLPHVELLARIAAAAALVISLTAASDLLGSELTGILTGAPIAAVVIPAFTLANAGRDAMLIALRGFLTGMMGFAVFFLILAPAIAPLGALAFLPATIGGVGVGFAATWLMKRRVQRRASPLAMAR